MVYRLYACPLGVVAKGNEKEEIISDTKYLK